VKEHILVVDDSAVVRQAFSMILGRQFSIDTAADPIIAVRRIQKRRPSVIVYVTWLRSVAASYRSVGAATDASMYPLAAYAARIVSACSESSFREYGRSRPDADRSSSSFSSVSEKTVFPSK